MPGCAAGYLAGYWAGGVGGVGGVGYWVGYWAGYLAGGVGGVGYWVVADYGAGLISSLLTYCDSAAGYWAMVPVGNWTSIPRSSCFLWTDPKVQSKNSL